MDPEVGRKNSQQAGIEIPVIRGSTDTLDDLLGINAEM
jgi:hypothetical protein